MAWIREDDVLERVDAPRPESEPMGHLRVEHDFEVVGENDASISFLHDLEKLLNKYIVHRRLTALGKDGFKEHYIPFVQDDVAQLVADFGDVDSRIHLKITTVLGIGSAKRDDPARVQEAIRCFADRRKIFVSDTQRETRSNSDMQDTHGGNGLTGRSPRQDE